MSKINKVKLRRRRIKRNRTKISGVIQCPRLAVFRSNKHISAQIINDKKQQTLLSVCDKELNKDDKITKTEVAYQLGSLLAKKAVKKNIKKCVFDRRWYKYHGRVKSFAEGARKSGLKF